MEKIALRGFSDIKNKMKKFSAPEIPNIYFPRVVVVDTETTVDERQNLKFGYFEVREKHVIVYRGLFWDDRHVTGEEQKILEKYAEKNRIRLFSLEEFIEIFYLEVYEREALCVGFNLNFDLSRIIQDYGQGRHKGKDGFSFKLTEDKFRPRLRITHLNGRNFNVEFTKAPARSRKKGRTFKGYFLDVQNLACILTDRKSLSLEQACEIFDTTIKKKESDEHGKITPKYIEYNIKDVKATYEVFEKVLEELARYNLEIPITRVYSSASLSKQALLQCGITPFLEQNYGFSKRLMGRAMSAYYGGRCECRIRKTPVKVTVLDFFSQYPTVMILLDLWKFIIAGKIKRRDDTKNVREFVDSFTPEKALDKESWAQMNVLVELEPDEDVLPVRTNYGDQETFNIGINHITYEGSLYYFLPDVLASKLLTGKSPKIKKAIRFYPEGVQETLQETDICGIHVDPRKDNLVKLLVERRQEIKNKRDKIPKNSHEYELLDAQQKAAKILNNTMSYGIFVEMNPKDTGKFQMHSNADFYTEGKYEEPGKFFHPIVGANIAAGARLLLAIAEKFVLDRGEVHAYMDTDSIFVPPHLAEELSHLFDSLNPYDFKKPILEIEEGMEDIWFYGISSKRYCLFKRENGKIWIPDGKKLFYKLHGLGHVTNPFRRTLKDGDDWHKQFWLDILRVHFNPESLDEVLEKYKQYAVISRQTITTWNIQESFGSMNKGKPFDKQIKPFNFFLVGNGTVTVENGRNSRQIKPIAPFNKNPQSVVEAEFLDKYTGEQFSGREYWKPLSDLIFEYIDHPEAKFEGDVGVLKRRHLKPEGCIHIGKEANKLENEVLEGLKVDVYYDLEKLKEFILELTPEKARKIGIKHRSTLKGIKDRVKKGEIKLNSSEMKKILKEFSNC